MKPRMQYMYTELLMESPRQNNNGQFFCMFVETILQGWSRTDAEFIWRALSNSLLIECREFRHFAVHFAFDFCQKFFNLQILILTEAIIARFRVQLKHHISKTWKTRKNVDFVLFWWNSQTQLWNEKIDPVWILQNEQDTWSTLFFWIKETSRPGPETEQLSVA